MPKGMLLFSTTTKLLEFSHNHVVIYHMYKQRNVCRTNGAPCLHLVRTDYYLNNITNNLAVTLRTCSGFHTCIYSFSIVFNNLVNHKLSQITCSVCFLVLVNTRAN